MGAKIRSKVEVVYDPRDQTYGAVIIELTNWTYNVGQGYTATIRDMVESESPAGVSSTANMAYPSGSLRNKTKSFTLAEVDGLYEAISQEVGEFNTSVDYTTHMYFANNILIHNPAK